jgi:uncharacterized OB-fold protein
VSNDAEPAPPQRMEPPTSKVSTPFWEATREKRLVLQHCSACAKAIWFPRVLCPHCSGSDLRWRDATGRGTVYAVSVQYRPGSPQLKDRVPYAVALIDLDEGVRMMSNVIVDDAESVAVGDSVEAAWEALSDGRNLVVFQPSAS